MTNEYINFAGYVTLNKNQETSRNNSRNERILTLSSEGGLPAALAFKQVEEMTRTRILGRGERTLP